MKNLTILVLTLILCVGLSATGHAQISPTMSTVSPADALNGMVLTPNTPQVGPIAVETITVRNVAGAPVPGVTVTVVFPSPANLLCPSTVLAGVTNASGQVAFKVGGGGCTAGLPGACLVIAGGVTLRNYSNAKSPDWDGTGGDGQVNLADLLAFANEFTGVSPTLCHDYNNDGVVNLADLIVFSPLFLAATFCS